MALSKLKTAAVATVALLLVGATTHFVVHQPRTPAAPAEDDIVLATRELGAARPDLARLKEALAEQLGLELAPATREIEVLVVHGKTAGTAPSAGTGPQAIPAR